MIHVINSSSNDGVMMIMCVGNNVIVTEQVVIE